MTTLSVPLTPELEKFVNRQVKEGNAANKADVIRKALKFFREQQAVAAVLSAEREPTLKGDLRDLMKRI